MDDSRQQTRKSMWQEWRRTPFKEWSWRTRVTSFILAMVLVLVWVIIVDKAQDASAAATPATSQIAQRCAISGDEVPCGTWSKKQAKRFRQGKTGNSRNVQAKFMPKRKWTRLVNAAKKRYVGSHRSARLKAGWCDVCDYVFQASRCMSNGLFLKGAPGCAEAKEDAESIHRIGNRIGWFTIRCGGSAMIGVGSVAGKSARAAIFRGALACGWAEAAYTRTEPCGRRVSAARPERCRPQAFSRH